MDEGVKLKFGCTILTLAMAVSVQVPLVAVTIYCVDTVGITEIEFVFVAVKPAGTDVQLPAVLEVMVAFTPEQTDCN